MTARLKDPVNPEAVRQITYRLNDAATQASALMTQIDDGDISAEMQRRFSDVLLRTAAGVDQARQLNNAFTAMYQTLAWEQAEISMAMEAILERQLALAEQVKGVIEASPDVPFRDSHGKKVFVRASNPSLKLAFEDRKKTVAHIAPEELDIPPRFLKTVSYTVVDTEAVRAAIKDGENLPFAWLEQGQSLCGL